MLNYQSARQLKNLARVIERLGAIKGRPLNLGEALDALAKGQGFKSWGALVPTLTRKGVDAGLSEIELTHLEDAEAVGSDSYGDECGIQVHTGFYLRAPAYPAACEYVRVCDPLGREIQYWHRDEWQEAPDEVMGAIIGALCRGTTVTAPVVKNFSELPDLPGPAESDVARAMSAEYWPPQENMSRKELVQQIGQMNFALDTLRKQTASLTARNQAQAAELTTRQNTPFKVPMYWKLVPEVADAAMKNAAHNRLKFDGTFVASFIYDAMLDAAPKFEA